MRTLEKRYVVSVEIEQQIRSAIRKYSGTFNRQKFGRHRRGKVMIRGVNFRCIGDGTLEIVVSFYTGTLSYIRFCGGKRFKTHEFSDFRKLLRMLAIADTSR